ncbi:hypothetical protein LNP17_10845 [Klebsiella variicola subsp. variicola]|nr:hypothetical protein [Klebsiella variicola subsp. variicola]
MKEIKRRNAWIAFSLALVVFLAGVFVINWQLWHSDQATHVAAARQAAKRSQPFWMRPMRRRPRR